ncbi:MAG: ECF transporter S component [Christensenellales bacterium]|jgi:uncharacterized membrane protein
MSNKTKYIAYVALFTALVAVATMVTSIPIPGTQGFINFGDAIILTAALTLGGVPAAICGGIGSAVADLVLGYAVWAPFTLVIKALEGLIAYLVYAVLFKRGVNPLNTSSKEKIQGALSLIAGALFMVVGYYFASVVVIGTFGGALASIPSNLLQGLAGALVAYLLVFAARVGRFLK